MALVAAHPCRWPPGEGIHPHSSGEKSLLSSVDRLVHGTPTVSDKLFCNVRMAAGKKAKDRRVAYLWHRAK